jgi:8-oxo-dGTP pyrophosphatase MutT (NUDIX family)
MALNARAKLERLTKLRPADPDYAIFQAGVEYGEDQLKKKALGFLQAKYMADDAPDRGTPEATAILALARELSEELNK